MKEKSRMTKEQLIAGMKEITALFEEADGIWINLQGKYRKERLEKNKEKAKQQEKDFNLKMKIKTELKLHVMYEGWKKGDPRHSLVNKEYIAGIMKPKEIAALRDARVHQKYDESKIKLRVVNGDGAKWTKGITSKDGIYQKDQFHIMQEIVRDVPKEYRNIMSELVKTKQFNKIPTVINELKYELGGEYDSVNRLNKLQSYLSNDLARYQDLVEVPEAPKGIEYRNMGTQESQIFSKLKKRFCSGRKAFSIHGVNALSKICVLSEKIKMDDIEKDIKKNKQHRANRKETEDLPVKRGTIDSNIKILKEITKIQDFTDLKYSF